VYQASAGERGGAQADATYTPLSTGVKSGKSVKCPSPSGDFAFHTYRGTGGKSVKQGAKLGESETVFTHRRHPRNASCLRAHQSVQYTTGKCGNSNIGSCLSPIRHFGECLIRVPSCVYRRQQWLTGGFILPALDRKSRRGPFWRVAVYHSRYCASGLVFSIN